MTKVCYLASDVQFDEKNNPYAEFYSINEALEKNVIKDISYLDGIDRDLPGTIACFENEEDIDFPTIFNIQLYSNYSISKKKYFVEVGGKLEKHLDYLIKYINEHMSKCDKGQTLELWYIWLDDVDNYIEDICNLNELTEEYLKKVFLNFDIDYKITITK